MDADGFLSRPPAHPCPLPVPPEFSVALSSLCPGRETPEARDLLAILRPVTSSPFSAPPPIIRSPVFLPKASFPFPALSSLPFILVQPSLFLAQVIA